MRLVLYVAHPCRTGKARSSDEGRGNAKLEPYSKNMNQYDQHIEDKSNSFPCDLTGAFIDTGCLLYY